VVSFRSGGLVEAVEDGVTALLSEEKDVTGLAENITALLENSSLRHHMGRAGRERVEQYFDLRKQCAKLESIYEKLP
jgi:glycosyltransferase involved in cell wall biosynthesis